MRKSASHLFLVSLAAFLLPLLVSAGDLPTGQLVEGIACGADQTQTYTLYLPTRFRPGDQLPALLVFDPRGRSKMAAEIFQSAAEEYGWLILSSDNTRSDGPWEPNDRAMRAMWPELFERWNANPERIYVAGFSGGAIAAIVLAEMTRQVAGIIASGGRPPEGVKITETGYSHFGSAGLTDFNYRPMWTLDEQLAKRGNPHRMEVFEGRHQWLPEDLALLGVEWLEVEAIRKGIGPRDDELVERLFAQELEDAHALETEGRKLEALWRYQTITRTFESLHDLATVSARISRLSADRELQKERKERRRLDAWEDRYWRQIAPVQIERSDPTEDVARPPLFSPSAVRRLKKQAGNVTYEGTVAQRILERIWVQTSFYMARDFLSQERYRSAMDALSIAVEIRDDSQYVWYNLACAAAQSGAKKRALEALDRAIDLGFRDLDHITSDGDLESLRGEPAFQALLAALESELSE